MLVIVELAIAFEDVLKSKSIFDSLMKLTNCKTKRFGNPI